MFTSEIMPNDIIRITEKMRDKTETYDIRITDAGHRVDEKTGEMYMYAGFVPVEAWRCGFGYTKLYNPGKEHAFGVVAWEKVGHVEPKIGRTTNIWSPAPGNRGYDLMC